MMTLGMLNTVVSYYFVTIPHILMQSGKYFVHRDNIRQAIHVKISKA